MQRKPCLIQFTDTVLRELDRYAVTMGISRNAAVNMAAELLCGRSAAMEQEIKELRSLIVKVALAKGGFDV